MLPENHIIALGSTILVTGANGYIASHVCDILLGLGYRKYGEVRFETVVAGSLAEADTWSPIVDGVDGIVQMATETSFSTDVDKVVPWVVKATLNALEAASKQPRIKSVVLTSSAVAASFPQYNAPRVKIDQYSWNEGALAQAYSKDTLPGPFIVYTASKLQGERGAWNWVRDNQPHFKFNSVLPGLNLGKILCSEIGGSTMSWFESVLKGSDDTMKLDPAQYFVDVEGTARLHVVALLSPEVESQRIFAYAEPYTWTKLVGILRELRPENNLIPDAPVDEAQDLSDPVEAPKAERMIQEFFDRPGWTGLKESIVLGIEGRFY